MADANQGIATLRTFRKHLESLRNQLQLLQFSTNEARRKRLDNVGERGRFLSVFESAYDSALRLLQQELRALIPESAVENTTKAWCITAEKTLDRLACWFRQLAYVGVNRGVYPPVLFAAQRNHFGGAPMFGDVPPDAEQRSQTLVDEVNETVADIVRFSGVLTRPRNNPPNRTKSKALRGVSLMDAALAANDGDEEAAVKTKKRYHKHRDSLPPSVGCYKNHTPTKLYEPSAIAEFAATVDGLGKAKRKSMARKLGSQLKDCATT